jgi:hypothetical protein
MFGKRKDNHQATQVSPGCAKMVQQIQDTFPGTAWNLDVLTKEITISVAINNDLLLGVSLPYNFPSSSPVVTLLNANGRYLAGLEAMGSCGLLDPFRSVLHGPPGWLGPP